MALTREELERTSWAAEFRADSPVSFGEAIRMAMQTDFAVDLRETDENGELVWAVVAIEGGEDSGFWMDAKPTRAAAEAICTQMGWPIRSVTPRHTPAVAAGASLPEPQISLDDYIARLQALRTEVGGGARVVVSGPKSSVGDPVLSVGRVGKTTPYKLVAQRGIACVVIASDRS